MLWGQQHCLGPRGFAADAAQCRCGSAERTLRLNQLINRSAPACK
jgi:hypothetical protein